MTTQPEALRLTQVAPYLEGGEKSQWIMSAIRELRRLHEINSELLAALETLRYVYASHGNHAYCQVGTEDDVLNLVDAAINKAERTTT